MSEIKILKKLPIIITKDAKFLEEVTQAKEGAIICLPADAILVEVNNE